MDNLTNTPLDASLLDQESVNDTGISSETLDVSMAPAPVLEAPMPPMEPMEPVSSNPIKPYQDLLASLKPDEKAYFAENPDQLEAFLVTNRKNSLLKDNPSLSADMAFDQAYGELAGEWDLPKIDTKIAPVPLASPKEDRWMVRRLADAAIRGLSGVVSGGLDTTIEAVSGTLRLADYALEKVSFGYIDPIDDVDSIVYKYKEGLSEETKESIKSLGGLIKVDQNPLINLTSDLTSIFAGGYLISQLALAGAAIKVASGATIGEGIAASKGGLAISGFLSNNQRMAKVLGWTLDGASRDIAAAMTVDPTTLLSLAPDMFKGANDEFNNLSILSKRGVNLAEGLFINTVFGFLGAGKNALAKAFLGGTGDVSKEASETIEALKNIHKNISNDVLALDDTTAKSLLLGWDGATRLADGSPLIKEADVVRKVLKTEPIIGMPEGLILKQAPDIIEEAPQTGLFLKKTPSIEIPDVELPAGLLLKEPPKPIEAPLFLKSILTDKEVAEVSTKEIAEALQKELPKLSSNEMKSLDSLVSKRGTEKALSAAQVKLLDKVTEEAKRLDMTPDELIDRLAKPKALAENVPPKAQLEIASEVKRATTVKPTAPTAPSGIQRQGANDVPIGAADKQKAIRFENPEDARIFSKVKGYVGNTKELPKTLVKELGPAATDRANTLLQALRAPAKELSDNGTLMVKADFTVAPIKGVTIISEGKLQAVATKKGITPEAALDRIVAAMRKDIKTSKGQISQNFLPINTISALISAGGNFGLKGIKLAGKFAEYSGLLGGASTVYLGNLDVNFDGTVDFTDVAIGALGFSLGGILNARSRYRKEALDKLGTDALVKMLEKNNQRVASVYLTTRELLANAQHTIPMKDVPKLESLVNKLEKYLLSSNDNVGKLLNDPEVIARMKTSHAVAYTSNDLVNLGKTLRLNKQYLPADSPFVVGKYNFTNPATFQDEFDILYTDALKVFQANQQYLTTVHLTSSIKRVMEEVGVSNEAKELLFRGAAPEAAARIHVARGLLSSIDAEIKTLAKIPDLSLREVYDLSLRINQRRSVVEYLRNGALAGGENFMKAQAQATKAAMLGLNPENYLQGMAWSRQTKETLTLANKYLKVIDSGPRLTKFLDGLGENLTMGQAAVQALYMSLFSNPLTWGKAWAENTLSTATALMSEGMSTAYGVATGVNTSASFLGERGFVSGLLSNIGNRAQEALDVATGKSLGFDVVANKEFADIRAITKFQYEFGLENAGMWTRGMNHLMKWVGIDPIAMTMAPDVFFKGLLFDAYQNKHLVEAAFDDTRLLRGLSIDDAIKEIENNKEAMAAIRENSLKKARDYTFTSDLSRTKSLTQHLIEMRTDNVLLRMLLPVFKTPLLASRHFMRHIPLLGAAVGEDRRLLTEWASRGLKGKAISPEMQRKVLEIGGRMTAGFITMSSAYYGLTTMGFDIIGSGKFDPGMQAKREQGIQPFSVVDRKTGASISLDRLVHFKATLGLMADIRDKVTHLQDGEVTDEDHGILESAGFMASLIFENTAPDQVTDLISLFGAVRNEDTVEAKISGSWFDFAGRVLPSIFRAVGNDADPIKRATSDQIERALASYYGGIGTPEKFRPSLDLYGQEQRKDTPLRNDPMLLAAEDAGYNIRDYMKRRSTIGGVKLGSDPDEQAIALRAEQLHGEAVKRKAPETLKLLNKLPDVASKNKALSRMFQGVSQDVLNRLKLDPEVGAKVRRLLDKGGNLR